MSGVKFRDTHSETTGNLPGFPSETTGEWRCFPSETTGSLPSVHATPLTTYGAFHSETTGNFRTVQCLAPAKCLRNYGNIRGVFRPFPQKLRECIPSGDFHPVYRHSVPRSLRNYGLHVRRFPQKLREFRPPAIRDAVGCPRPRPAARQSPPAQPCWPASPVPDHRGAAHRPRRRGPHAQAR